MTDQPPMQQTEDAGSRAEIEVLTRRALSAETALREVREGANLLAEHASMVAEVLQRQQRGAKAANARGAHEWEPADQLIDGLLSRSSALTLKQGGQDQGEARANATPVVDQEGWKLVPVEMTAEMLLASARVEWASVYGDDIPWERGEIEAHREYLDAARNVWAAALDLAPAQPTSLRIVEGQEQGADLAPTDRVAELEGALERTALRIEHQIPATRAYLVNKIDPHVADILLSHYAGFARDARALLPSEERGSGQ